MILRAMGLGFLVWLAVAAAFRFAGHLFFLTDKELLVFLAAPIAGVAVTFVLLKLLREAPGDEGEAAIGLALPVLLLNAYITHEFFTAFPNLLGAPMRDLNPSNPGALGADAFGAWSLLFAGSILFMGLFMTRLAPQDERV